MTGVKILASVENEFIISADATDDVVGDKGMGVTVTPLLRYKDGINAVACLIRVIYDLEGRQMMVYSAMITVEIEGWAAFLAVAPTEEEKIAFTSDAWRAVIDFARGAISSKAEGQKNMTIASRLLPQVDMQEFMKAVSIEQVA